MKIGCVCGKIIYDQTDYISYKAYAIPDQDLFDLYDELDVLLEQAVAGHESNAVAAEQMFRSISVQISRTIGQYTKRLYQCTHCGRLYIEDETLTFRVFSPDEHTLQSSILRSVHDDQWKRPLRGHWSSSSRKGRVWNIVNAEEDAEWFDDWDAVQARYFEIFNRLRDKGILRDALLKKDGNIAHQWSSE